jgi:hypothetical protein
MTTFLIYLGSVSLVALVASLVYFGNKFIKYSLEGHRAFLALSDPSYTQTDHRGLHNLNYLSKYTTQNLSDSYKFKGEIEELNKKLNRRKRK